VAGLLSAEGQRSGPVLKPVFSPAHTMRMSARRLLAFDESLLTLKYQLINNYL